MEFCPKCGNLLQIEPARSGRRLRLFCPTCPYVCPVTNKIVKSQQLVKNDIEPVFGGPDIENAAEKTATTCPRCHHGEAFFWQAQILSFGEPKTKYYRCCNKICEYIWEEE